MKLYSIIIGVASVQKQLLVVAESIESATCAVASEQHARILEIKFLADTQPDDTVGAAQLVIVQKH